MESSIWLWVAFNLFVLGLLALDLGVLHREPRQIKVGEAIRLSLFYVVLALIFSAGLFWLRGPEDGIDFLTGYFVEKSLSVDNIFVIVLLFTYFQVPPQYQHRVLFWGILGALVMRGLLIFAGVQLIHQFAWMALLFGAFLIVTGIKMLVVAEQEPDLENNIILKAVRRRVRLTDGYRGKHFFLRENGLLFATPLFLVLVMIEVTDLIFAVDSIPAIIAITTDPFIVYTSNVFAILGLRALYFALAGIVPRFIYLKYGLALVLLVIGFKMIANYFYGGKFIPTEMALLATVLLIGGSIIVSLIKTRGQLVEPQTLPTGWIPGSGVKEEAEPEPAEKAQQEKK
ncbi:TerC family protein [Methyloligella sp. 2.7D]|uniref:TerC family protein n=1 Tax=unclassified Methyloligella TaxID=2625955 RepID=UPI00157E11A6|nr:TerC family protein [Methyloligella sp. GL2]QKP77226.1 TerC family protein [Methyloligella sp. GL2]